MPRFLRTLPPSEADRSLYGEVSAGNEWAVPGGFAYGDGEPGPQTGSLRNAFERCFLAVGSFAHSAMVEVAEIDADELDQIRLQLAFQMVQRLGAPGLGAALPVAQQEVEYTVSLCDLPLGTRLVMRRSVRDGDIQEDIRRVLDDEPPPIDHSQVRLWGTENENE